MVDAPKTKTKDAWTSWKNRPYATGDDQKKKTAEAFEALNLFVRRHGGVVVSPPGKTLRIEIAKSLSAKLADELTALGYAVLPRGSTMRITGVDTISPAAERYVGVQSPFCEMDCFEIRTDGK
jgi:hypothetical protein